ncbi:protein uxt-like protein, partial [Dinothrombium tinctorium]
PSTDRILVNAGLGFYVEMSREQALNFIAKKEKALKEESKKWTQQALKVKAHIAIVLKALAEMQGVDSGALAKG